MRNFKKLAGLGGILTATALLVFAAAPAGALPQPGLGGAATLLSPDLQGKPALNLADDGFPCQGGGTDFGFDSLKTWAGLGGPTGYTCSGVIYPTIVAGQQNRAVFSGSGRNGANTWSLTGAGTIAGSYTYSEPCQDVDPRPGPANTLEEALTGEAIGSLTLTLNQAAGNYNDKLISSATVKVDNFYWSRVGLTAVVGLKGSTITATTSSGTVTFSDPEAAGLAAALFIPTVSPNCATQTHPAPGAINIAAGTLTVG